LKAGEVACHADGPLTARRQRRAAAQVASYGKSRLEGVGPRGEAPGRRLADDTGVLSAVRRARRSSPALGPESIAALGGQKVFSATDIETYLQCPYRWYIERVIRPQEIDERFDASVVGRFVHEVMHRFYKELAERTGERRVTADLLSQARGIHAEVARTAVERVRAERIEDVLALKTGIDDTGRLIEEDVTFLPGTMPVCHEWSFGIDDEPEPVGDFLLAGRIDRIDADEREAVVIDYKRPAQASTRAYARFAEQGLVQLPLYALVASRRLSLEIGGGLYRPVRPGKPRGFISVDRMGPGFTRGDDADRETIAALVADAVERAQSAVNGMREGRIAPEPRGGRCPGHCSALVFCPERRPCHGGP
jgi:RecB family exonuclease